MNPRVSIHDDFAKRASQTRCRPWLVALAICLLGAMWPSAATAGTLYDNTSTRSDPARIAQDSGYEIGDEIILAGIGTHTVTNFEFEYFADGGTVDITLYFYANDGMDGRPSTVLLTSGPHTVPATGPAGNVLDFPDLSVAVAGNFTWAVKFEGVGMMGLIGAGLDLYNPPTVGNNFDDYWEKSGAGGTTWEVKAPGVGQPPLNFGARVMGTFTGPTTITQHPKDTGICPGGDAFFSVSAIGTGPLTYQWYVNAAPIGGATSSTLVVPAADVVPGDMYTVEVDPGSVFSSAATVTYDLDKCGPPSVLYDNTSTRSTTARFAQTTGFEMGDQIILAGPGPHTITNFQFEYFADGAGSVGITLTFYENDGVDGRPGTLIWSSGSFMAPVTGPAGNVLEFENLLVPVPKEFTWAVEFTGVGMAGLIGAGLDLYNPPTVGNNYDDYWERPTAGAWSLFTGPVALNFGARVLGIAQGPVTITKQPEDQHICPGSSATFMAWGIGTGPICFQWYSNGVPILGAISSTLVVPAPQVIDGDLYSVLISNPLSNVLSDPAAIVFDPSKCGPDSVLYDNTSTRSTPERFAQTTGFEMGDQIILAGPGPHIVTNFQFEYFADGAGDVGVTLTFYKNDGASGRPGTTIWSVGPFPAPVTGPAGNVLEFSDLWIPVPKEFTWAVEFTGVGMAGLIGAGLDLYNPPTVGNNYDDYWERPTAGAWGLFTGPIPLNFGARVLGVLQGPTVILEQPADQTICLGGSAVFSVTAIGAAPLCYQWLSNAVPIMGATSSTLVVPPMYTKNGDSYSVLITNPYGNVLSASAILTLDPMECVPFTDLCMWLRADLGVTTSGSFVTTWIDQSGPVFAHATQLMAGLQPTRVLGVINGLPVVRFDGVNDFMQFPLPINGLGNVTIFLVAANTSAQVVGPSRAERAAIFWNESAFWGTVYVSPFQSQLSFRYGTGQMLNWPLYPRPMDIGSSFTLTTTMKNSTTDSAWVNGTLVLSEGGKLSTIGNTLSVGNLGRGYNDNTYFIGDIAEVLVYKASLMPADREQVENYLITKYGLIGPQPPVIVTPPADKTVTESTGAGFSVAVSGTPPFMYQWITNGVDVSGATASTFAISPTVAAAHNGLQVQVRVSNGGGMVTSSAATLTVNSAPMSPVVIVTPPADLTVTAPASANFSVVVSGTPPFTYVWRTNGVIVTGVNSPNLVISPTEVPLNGMTVNVEVDNAFGPPVTSMPDAILTVLAPMGPTRVTDHLVALYDFREMMGTTVGDHSGFMTPVDLTIANPGNAPWIGGGVNGVNVNSSTIISSGGPATKISDAIKATDQMSMEAWVRPASTLQFGPARIASLSVGTATTQVNAHLGQGAGVFSTGIQGSARLRTSNNMFNWAQVPSIFNNTVDLIHIVMTYDGSLIRFYRNGALAGSLPASGNLDNWNSTYPMLIANELSLDRPWLGTIRLVAVYCKALSAMEVTQNYDAGPGTTMQPPVILTDPMNLVVDEPNPAMFSVSATGTLPLTYQWCTNSVPVPGATSPTFTISPTVAVAHNGLMVNVKVSNAYGGPISSATAMLTVNSCVAPSVTTPADQTVTAPSPATFMAVASGTGPFIYQWITNGVDVPGATSSSFTINPTTVAAHNNLMIEVKVTGACGMMTSTPATVLKVNAPAGRVTTDLIALYLFNEMGGGATVKDRSGFGSPLDLTILDLGKVMRLGGGLNGVMFVGGGMNSAIQSPGPATKVNSEVTTSGQFTMEAWVIPANLTQFGPARIMTVSAGTTTMQVNMHMGQGTGTDAGMDGSGRVRNTGNFFNWLQQSGVFTSTVTLHHIVITYDGSVLRLYKNGVQIGPGLATPPGTLANWDASYKLTLGNEVTFDRSWFGTMRLSAIYRRALSLLEIQQNFAAGATFALAPFLPASGAGALLQVQTEGNHVVLTLSGEPGQSYLVERSLDLKTWTGVTTMTPPDSEPAVCEEVIELNGEVGFFRAVVD